MKDYKSWDKKKQIKETSDLKEMINETLFATDLVKCVKRGARLAFLIVLTDTFHNGN